MFDKLRHLLRINKPLGAPVHVDKLGEPVDEALCEAVIVLLFEMAGADEDIEAQEGSAMCDLLGQQFALEEAQIPPLVESAIARRKASEKIDDFVELVNERFSVSQRTRLFALLWKMVLADGKVERNEERFTTQMRFRFQLSDEQAQFGRQMVERGEV